MYHSNQWVHTEYKNKHQMGGKTFLFIFINIFKNQIHILHIIYITYDKISTLNIFNCCFA